MKHNLSQRVLISIDTEGPAGNDPVETLIYGKTSSGMEYGISYLMNLFDEYEAKGLFFVDFAEAWDYGEEKIAKVVQTIIEKGHNVGVHIHPDHMADKERRYLWQYTYDEQFEIISKCTDLYKSITGKIPLSFRAGRYGADNNTISIINQLGYKYDMSEFYGNRYCKINPPLCINRITNGKDMNLQEVPVTSFRSFKNPFYTRFDKIDSAMDSHEFKRVMKRIYKENTVDVIDLFVHSFSVLNWRKDPDHPYLDKKLLKKLLFQLEFVRKNEHLCFISEADLEYRDNYIYTDDVELDVSQGVLPYWFLMKKAIRVMIDRRILNV